MTRAGKPKPRKDRGGRYCMMLELEKDDKEYLETLVERYQKLLGPVGGKASRALVIRQLIRHAVDQKSLPVVKMTDA